MDHKDQKCASLSRILSVGDVLHVAYSMLFVLVGMLRVGNIMLRVIAKSNFLTLSIGIIMCWHLGWYEFIL